MNLWTHQVVDDDGSIAYEGDERDCAAWVLSQEAAGYRVRPKQTDIEFLQDLAERLQTGATDIDRLKEIADKLTQIEKWWAQMPDGCKPY